MHCRQSVGKRLDILSFVDDFEFVDGAQFDLALTDGIPFGRACHPVDSFGKATSAVGLDLDEKAFVVEHVDEHSVKL